MAKEETSSCEVCGVRLTIKHIVTECTKYDQDRYKVKMEEIIDTTLGRNTANNKKILQFLKSTNLYNKI